MNFMKIAGVVFGSSVAVIDGLKVRGGDNGQLRAVQTSQEFLERRQLDCANLNPVTVNDAIDTLNCFRQGLGIYVIPNYSNYRSDFLVSEEDFNKVLESVKKLGINHGLEFKPSGSTSGYFKFSDGSSRDWKSKFAQKFRKSKSRQNFSNYNILLRQLEAAEEEKQDRFFKAAFPHLTADKVQLLLGNPKSRQERNSNFRTLVSDLQHILEVEK